MPLPEYRYGKVTDQPVDLTVVSERSESPMVCCGYCSAHMAARTAKAGLSTRMENEAHAIRKAGGRPHNHGNTASELRNGAQIALGVTLKSIAIDDIPARLRAGFAITAGVQYADMPSWLKVQTNDFGHAVCLYGWDAAVQQAGFFDPLWTQGARGAWVPWVQVKNALWPNGNHSTTTVRLVKGGTDVGIYFNPARWIAGQDIDVFLDSDCTQRLFSIKSGTEFSTVGYKAVVDSDGYTSSVRAVRVTTGQLVPGSGDPAVEAILWAKGSEFPTKSVPTSTEWDDSIWRLMGDPTGRYPSDATDGGASEEELLAAKQEGYDLALSAFPPRPE